MVDTDIKTDEKMETRTDIDSDLDRQKQAWLISGEILAAILFLLYFGLEFISQNKTKAYDSSEFDSQD